MTAFVDTSVVVRYLTNDPPDLARKAAEILDAGPSLLLTGVVLAETAYVLMRSYGLPRYEVADSLIEFVQKENVSLVGMELGYVLDGLQMCRLPGRVSFSDALIWASARSSGDRPVYSFGRRFPSEGITVIGEG